MEIMVSISAIVIIQDGNVNVNEILHEAGKFGDLLKKKMAEKIIEHYQEAIVSRMCDRGEGLGIEHTRRGTEEERCEGKSYIRQGWRKEGRQMRADFGDIGFKVRNVRCRSCGRIFAPIIRVLGIGSRERKADGLQLKIADMISKQSYGYGVGSLKDISGIRIPKSTARRWIVSEDWKDLELLRGAGNSLHLIIRMNASH